MIWKKVFVWRIIYTDDFGITVKTFDMCAATYTQAFIEFVCKHDGIILKIVRI